MSNPDNLLLEAASKIKRSAKGGRAFETAQVKIIGLGDVRNAAGLRMRSMNFLQSVLSESDIVIPCAGGFLIIYDEHADRNLDSETEALQQKLTAFCFGQPTHRSLTAEVTQHLMSSREVVGILAGNAGETPAPEAPCALRKSASRKACA
ncbi:MAG TPA: hypothetical protein VG735_07715 [Caulobacterales bacterium]|nr:hypothetical protein [Caulobacterales bacterium]